MGDLNTVPDYPRGVTFEQVWATLDRTGAFIEASTRRAEEAEKRTSELDSKFNERTSELDREFKERTKSLDASIREMVESMKATDKKISELGSRFGEMIEYMVKPNLIEKFRELGFVFTKVYPEAEIKDEKNQIRAAIDFTLENGDKVMIVEVKSKPSTKDIKDHLKRMETVRRHADLHGDKRIFLGSIAGMVINDNVREFALKNGFYIIEPSGDTFNITVPEGIYRPREW